ncbi:MAG: hypothetical protein LUF85_12515 [Bacteroides sp.]|nr:hypothetical protein [Bacteroides sp.]
MNVYPEKFGDKAVRGEFRIVPAAAEKDTKDTQRQVYELTLDKSVRTLILETTVATRAQMTTKNVSRVLLEDVTADFEEEYEGVEEVCTVQTIASEEK